MARDLFAAKTCTDMSTSILTLSTDLMKLISTANGSYIKTTGLDATRLLFVVYQRTSKQKADDGTIYVRSGSTAGKYDYEPGNYSTLRGLNITVAKSTIASNPQRHFFTIKETARFLDSNNYINFDYSTEMGKNGNTTEERMIGAIYLPR